MNRVRRYDGADSVALRSDVRSARAVASPARWPTSTELGGGARGFEAGPDVHSIRWLVIRECVEPYADGVCVIERPHEEGFDCRRADAPSAFADHDAPQFNLPRLGQQSRREDEADRDVQDFDHEVRKVWIAQGVAMALERPRLDPIANGRWGFEGQDTG